MRIMLVLTLFATVAHAAPSPELNRFRQILKDAGSSSPAVRSRIEKLIAAEKRAFDDKLSWTPRVSAKAARNVAGPADEAVSVTAEMNLLRFGADVSSWKSADRQIEQARLQREIAVVDQESKTAELLFTWIARQKKLANQKELLKLKSRLLDVAMERYRRGQLPEQEVEKARLDQKNSELQLAQEEVALIESRGALEAVVPGASKLTDWPWSHALTDGKFPLAKTLEKRREFLALALDVEISESRRWEATTGWLPSLDIGSTWVASPIQPLGPSETTTQITLTIPLWDRGTALSERGFWLHMKNSAEQDLEQFRRAETQRMGSLNERRELLRKVAADAQDSNRRARALAQQSLQRFQLGRSSVNDLLIDQQRLLDSDSLAQETLMRYHLTLLEACVAADETPSSCY